jgi:hypothetical protein
MMLVCGAGRQSFQLDIGAGYDMHVDYTDVGLIAFGA